MRILFLHGWNSAPAGVKYRNEARLRVGVKLLEKLLGLAPAPAIVEHLQECTESVVDLVGPDEFMTRAQEFRQRVRIQTAVIRAPGFSVALES